MAEFYFNKSDHEAQTAKTLTSWKEWMKDNGVKTMQVVNAVMEIGSEFFYCTHFQEIGEVGGCCGKQCSGYKPRNGKNGRCRFSNNPYTSGDQEKTITLSDAEMSESPMFETLFTFIAMITDVPDAIDRVSQIYAMDGWFRTSKTPLIFKKDDSHKVIIPIFNERDFDDDQVFDAKFCYGPDESLTKLREIGKSIKIV